MAKVGRRPAADARRQGDSGAQDGPDRKLRPPRAGRDRQAPQDLPPATGVWHLAPWSWPLLLALFLAPLIAGKVVDQLSISAVNGLVALALLLWAWRPGHPASDTPLAAPEAQDFTGAEPETRLHSGQAAAEHGRSIAAHPTFWLALFLTLNLVSLAVSIYRHATLTALLDLAAWFGAYWLITRGGRPFLPWAVGALLLSGGLAAVQALQEYAGRAWGANDPGWRAFGPFFNPNLLAAIAILLAPLCFSLMLRARRTLEAVAAAAGMVLFVAALLTSGSRGGALALLVSGPAFLLVAAVRRLRPGPRQLLAAAGLLLALLPVVWMLRVPMMGRLARVPGTPALAPGSPAAGASERSNAFRVQTWKSTGRIIAAKPLLGTGLGTFEYALPRYALVGYTQRAHQSYLQVASEAGVFALVAWLVALALLLFRLLWSRGVAADWLLPGIGAGLVAGMAHNIVDYSWSVTGTALPFWVFLGSVLALTTSQERSPGVRTERPSHLRLAVALGGLLLLGLNLVWHQAAAARERARAATRDGDARAAVEAYARAAALTPLDAALRIEQTRALVAAGDPQAAEAALRRATQLAPTWGRPYHVLGRLLERQGRLNEAEAAFQAAAERDPRNTQPLEALALVREAAGDHTGALEAWRRIIEIAEDPNSRIYALDGMTDPIPGLAYEAVGREEEQKDLDKAVRLYRQGAERLREWRRQRPFREQLRQARGDGPSERDPEYQRAETRLWQRLAAIYARQGRTAEASEARRELRAAGEAEAEQAGDEARE